MWYHLSDTKPKARKGHQCYLCNRPIPKGTVHIARSGIGDEGPDTFRMHIPCEALTLKWDQGDWECHDAGEFRDSLMNNADDDDEPHVVSKEKYPAEGQRCELTARYTKDYDLIGVRAKDKIGIRPLDNINSWLKGPVSHLCSAVPAYWSERERAYVMSITAARVVQLAHLRGWAAEPSTAYHKGDFVDPNGIRHTYPTTKQILLK